MASESGVTVASAEVLDGSIINHQAPANNAPDQQLSSSSSHVYLVKLT